MRYQGMHGTYLNWLCDTIWNYFIGYESIAIFNGRPLSLERTYYLRKSSILINEILYRDLYINYKS